MSDPFLIALREALQASVLLSLVLFSPPARDDRGARWSAVLGVLAGLGLGLVAGAVPAAARALGSHEHWTFWRHATESVIFYGSLVLLIRRPAPSPLLMRPGMFLLGIALVLFESRTLAFIVSDMGTVTGRPAVAFGWCGLGLLAGMLPLVLLRGRLRKLPFSRTFTPASLLMTVGALRFWFGGLAELGGESIMIPLQKGLQLFVNESMKSIQGALLLTDHPFLDVTFSGLAQYLGSDRSALTATVLFLMVPPVVILISLFSRPDPVVDGAAASSRRRQDIAAFRQDLTLQSAPVLAAFVILVVLLHAVNISLNPLYDPEPVPVREAEGTAFIRIPISGKAGDLGDKKLRKFVYYEGSKQVLFIAIMKADQTVGVALDQCEICRPADWNKDARGYAQQGENLFCKYCVTPIATSTLGTPGGCNPIPVPFRVEENTIVIGRDVLVSTFDKAEALERKGTHL